MSKIQITSISQAIDLLKKAKQEYHALLAHYKELEKENIKLKGMIPTRSKAPEGFEQLFGSFRNES